ncbi:MAG TPA: hypothetical protein GX513_06050, partial [Firmicutes bacterium]|nr:hypothetical protein [Bacillota bacterium]
MGAAKKNAGECGAWRKGDLRVGKGKRKAGREVTPPGKGGGQNLREGSRHVLASLLVGCPLLVLLGVGPFFRGLFFPGEYLVALAVVFALFAGYYLYASGRQYERPWRPIEWAGLALAVCYWAASLVAVQPRTAVAEALKYTAYMAVLWLVARLAGERRWAFAVAGVLVASATGVAILGLGVPAGTFSYTGAFDGGRLSSSLQYPNTAATYLSAGIILAAGLAAAIMPLATQVHASAGKAGLTVVTGGLLAGAIAVMFMAFAFTMSRGGYLVFPPLVLVLIASLPAGR